MQILDQNWGGDLYMRPLDQNLGAGGRVPSVPLVDCHDTLAAVQVGVGII